MVVDHCSWDNPGQNPYAFHPSQAVSTYTDIPKSSRENLIRRMDRREYDDIVVIKKGSLEGKKGSYQNLREMHFGKNKVCTTVSMDKWADTHEEIGLVYCEGTHCLIVPTVCKNVSRITPKPAITLPPPVALEAPPVDYQEVQATTPPSPVSVSSEEPSFSSSSSVGYWGVVYTPPLVSWVPSIPEPSTYALFALGLVLIAFTKGKTWTKISRPAHKTCPP